MSPLVKACLVLCVVPLLWLGLMACQAKRYAVSTLNPYDPYTAWIYVEDDVWHWPVHGATVTVAGHDGDVLTNHAGGVIITPVLRPIHVTIAKAGFVTDRRFLQGPGVYRVVLYTTSFAEPLQ